MLVRSLLRCAAASPLTCLCAAAAAAAAVAARAPPARVEIEYEKSVNLSQGRIAERERLKAEHDRERRMVRPHQFLPHGHLCAQGGGWRGAASL